MLVVLQRAEHRYQSGTLTATRLAGVVRLFDFSIEVNEISREATALEHLHLRLAEVRVRHEAVGVPGHHHNLQVLGLHQLVAALAREDGVVLALGDLAERSTRLEDVRLHF